MPTTPRTATSPPANGGNCTNRGATRRRHAGRMLLMVQNPHHYPWRHAPSLASCSLTSAGQPGGAPINADRASPTEPGQGNGRPAPRRRLWPMRRCAPIEKSQSQLIGRNAPSRVECSRSDAILQMGFIQSMALRRERASPMLPPSTMPGTEPQPTRCAPYPQARHPSAQSSPSLPEGALRHSGRENIHEVASVFSYCFTGKHNTPSPTQLQINHSG